MRHRLLPGTTMSVPVVGLGTWPIAGPNTIGQITMGWRSITSDRQEATVLAALDEGIDLFDTADIYGRGAAELLLGQLLSAGDPPPLVATKVGLLPEITPDGTDIRRSYSRQHIERSLASSLRRLGRDHIDLYQLHGPPVDVLQSGEVWEALERAVDAGHVRYVGVSISSRDAAQALDVVLSVPLVRVVQMKYSLAHPQAAELARRASDSGRAVIARVPFGHGVLLGRYTRRTEFAWEDHRRRRLTDQWIARVHRFRSMLHAAIPDRMRDPVELPLLWLLADPAVSVVLCGATHPRQVRNIAEAVRRPPIAADERYVVTRIAEEVFGQDAPAGSARSGM